MPPLALAAFLASALLFFGFPAGAEFPPEPQGYRLGDYRGPTPLTVAGRDGLDVAGARRLWEAGAIFVDVLPALRRPETLPSGSLWAPRPRKAIPGSVWLPDFGRGALDEEREAWFRARLTELSGGDPARPIVFYCLAECWMSWNATKRALEWGFRNAFWYREGPEEWAAAGLPLVDVRPPRDRPRRRRTTVRAATAARARTCRAALRSGPVRRRRNEASDARLRTPA